MEKDTVGTCLTSVRHGLADNGGAGVSYFDGNLSYSRFNNDLSANMSDGTYVDGNTASDA